MNNEGLGKLFDKIATNTRDGKLLILEESSFISLCQSPELREMVVGTCEWKDDSFDEDRSCFNTQCGTSFCYLAGNLDDNKQVYCHKCGGKIIELK